LRGVSGRRVFWYYRIMLKQFAVLMLAAVFAGCSGWRKSDSSDSLIDNSREESSIAKPPAYALPGVPLKNDIPSALPAEVKPAAPKPAEPEPTAPKPAEPEPAGVKPAGTADDTGKDLAFHLAAAGKYAARKSYRSAAAEYGAAIPFLPVGDARAVHLLERQGAMMLRAGDEPKARERFLASIRKAEELKTSGNDLAAAYLGLGYCQEKEKKAPDAITSYEKAMELSGSKVIKARIAKTINDLKKTP